MNPAGRIMGLDVGDVRIGVALSDPLGIIAQAHHVISCTTLARDIEAVGAIATEQHATRIVVGLPLNQNGEPGKQARKVLDFVEQLRAALEIEVCTQDERFSTVAAERMLISGNVSRKKRRKVVDKVAAQVILQTYLDRQASLRARREP